MPCAIAPKIGLKERDILMRIMRYEVQGKEVKLRAESSKSGGIQSKSGKHEYGLRIS